MPKNEENHVLSKEAFREHVKFMDHFKSTRFNEKFARWLVAVAAQLEMVDLFSITDVDTVLAVTAYMDGKTAADYAAEFIEARR
ncbi:hypothetical protein LCGC14_1268130 [marine sediment metagenome]|uniref:Uncharacterized protein n=1 Tax=marine sediment metagenome TaxID=412755 RepID=A0A0F9NFL3_9ZZZZ